MDAAGNVVLGKHKRTAATKYVHDPELDQLLGEDSNDEMDEEDEEEEEDEEDKEGEEDEDGSGSDEEEGKDESGSDAEDKDADESGSDDEEWRPVPHRFLPPQAPKPEERVLYEVSSKGRVRSRRRRTARVLKPTVHHQHQYHQYNLAYGGRSKTGRAHDLVLGTFKGPDPGPKHLWHIDHIDRNIYNNALSNLRYVKAKHNLSCSRKPRVRKGPSTAKPRAWSYVAPDSPDRLQWRQHPTFPELEVAKEGHVRWAAGYAPNGKKKGRMLTPRSNVSGHLWVRWRAHGRQCHGSVHRLVYRTWVGHFPTIESAVNGKMAERLVLDHKDNIEANNNADNLEFMSLTANSRKRAGRNTNNTSDVNGVYKHKPTAKWMAYIPVKGKRRNLGYFDDKRDAKSPPRCTEDVLG